MRASASILETKPLPVFRWTAVLAALSIWILGLLAAAPQWHASLHSDAGGQDHSCAVTLFSHSTESAVTAACFVSAPVLFPAGECTVQPALPVADAENLFPPGRGPPLG